MSVYTRYTLGLTMDELATLFMLAKGTQSLSFIEPGTCPGAYGSLSMEFNGQPQYVHFDIASTAGVDVVAFFEGDPKLAEMLEIKGPYIALHELLDYLSIADDTDALVAFLKENIGVDSFISETDAPVYGAESVQIPIHNEADAQAAILGGVLFGATAAERLAAGLTIKQLDPSFSWERFTSANALAQYLAGEFDLATLERLADLLHVQPVEAPVTATEEAVSAPEVTAASETVPPVNPVPKKSDFRVNVEAAVVGTIGGLVAGAAVVWVIKKIVNRHNLTIGS